VLQEASGAQGSPISFRGRLSDAVLALRYYLVVYFRVSIGRVAAAALIGLALGFYVHHDFVAWSQRGREAFMAYEGRDSTGSLSNHGRLSQQ
jgi:hypothetical protein